MSDLNSKPILQQKIQDGTVKTWRILLILPLRLVLAIIFQGLTSIVFNCMLPIPACLFFSITSDSLSPEASNNAPSPLPSPDFFAMNSYAAITSFLSKISFARFK